jgi:hypothetical protein
MQSIDGELIDGVRDELHMRGLIGDSFEPIADGLHSELISLNGEMRLVQVVHLMALKLLLSVRAEVLLMNLIKVRMITVSTAQTAQTAWSERILLRLDRRLYDLLILFALFWSVSLLDKSLVALLALHSNQIQHSLLELMRVFFLTAVAKICFAYTFWNYSLVRLAFVLHLNVFLLLAESRRDNIDSRTQTSPFLFSLFVVSSQQLVTDNNANRTPGHNVTLLK